MVTVDVNNADVTIILSGATIQAETVINIENVSLTITAGGGSGRYRFQWSGWLRGNGWSPMVREENNASIYTVRVSFC